MHAARQPLSRAVCSPRAPPRLVPSRPQQRSRARSPWTTTRAAAAAPSPPPTPPPSAAESPPQLLQPPQEGPQQHVASVGAAPPASPAASRPSPTLALLTSLVVATITAVAAVLLIRRSRPDGSGSAAAAEPGHGGRLFRDAVKTPPAARDALAAAVAANPLAQAASTTPAGGVVSSGIGSAVRHPMWALLLATGGWLSLRPLVIAFAPRAPIFFGLFSPLALLDSAWQLAAIAACGWAACLAASCAEDRAASGGAHAPGAVRARLWLVNRGVVLVAALAALAVLRVPEKALIALGGGAGLSLAGIAGRQAASGALADAALVFSDALHEGDRVLVATVAGRVTKVSPTHTTILRDDAALVSIPNAVVSGGTVVNFDHSGVIPVHADFPLPLSRLGDFDAIASDIEGALRRCADVPLACGPGGALKTRVAIGPLLLVPPPPHITALTSLAPAPPPFACATIQLRAYVRASPHVERAKREVLVSAVDVLRRHGLALDPPPPPQVLVLRGSGGNDGLSLPPAPPPYERRPQEAADNGAGRGAARKARVRKAASSGAPPAPVAVEQPKARPAKAKGDTADEGGAAARAQAEEAQRAGGGGGDGEGGGAFRSPANELD